MIARAPVCSRLFVFAFFFYRARACVFAFVLRLFCDVLHSFDRARACVFAFVCVCSRFVL
jgi:hypothetical protein